MKSRDGNKWSQNNNRGPDSGLTEKWLKVCEKKKLTRLKVWKVEVNWTESLWKVEVDQIEDMWKVEVNQTESLWKVEVNQTESLWKVEAD